MTEFITIILVAYALLLLVGWIAWILKPANTIATKPTRRFSIVVPFRNEEKHLSRLLNSIKKLNYPKDQFELLLIDDQSSDSSVQVALECLSNDSIDFQLIQNKTGQGSPKKRAITTALQGSKYEYIACTDADCEVHENWLASINSAFEGSKQIQFVSAPVAFFDARPKSTFGRKIWNRLQQVEFSSLIGSGACAMILGQPNMCSGANIAYKKEAFQAVKGFEGNEHLASGDDEFLLHKISTKKQKSVAYLKSSEAVVYTEDQESLKSFFQQRKRWASKWSFYKSLSPKLVAVFIFLLNLFTILAFVKGLWWVLILRVAVEFVFLSTFLLFFKQKAAIPYILPLQVIYPFYVILFGLNSLRSTSYIWKERSLT